ncbi:restriction endonuclease subunit S [Acinetobacter nosocomialis]|uniref:restriction endonuclease subunit S n=1 Tax=Acinetobacter nosocomialis TaxID=106654 RepID=UPI0004615FD5|nr:restriction endonuclease subunit S [Acinetobacter nosocomialis]KCX91569.1 type I restriction modification DNA specificity domain protein [Acinetobacter baumannii 6112]OTK99512.1 hypothetical protein B9X83_14875 [Acinetobacter nosocomialis]
MYQKYDAYKDSGVQWLGNIPNDWEVVRFRDICTFSKGLNITKENLQDTGIPCVNYGEVHSKYGFEVSPERNELKCVSEDYLRSSPKSLLAYGDFIFADTSEDIDGSGNFTYLNSHVMTFAGYHTVIVRPKPYINVRYLAYVFDSLSFRHQIRTAVKGVKVYSITKAILKDTAVWLPDLDQQYEIAQFLDQKTAQIDQAIAIKEQQIALLNERKQIVIQQAVTKGLDPNVKMKDSGVEWIGEIPEHWEITVGMLAFSENKRRNKGMLEETVLSLSYGEIIIKPAEKLVGLVPESFETYQIVEPNDIIIRCIDLQNDKTSLRTGLSNYNGIITSAYLNLNVNNLFSAKYLHYYLHMLDVTKVLYKFGSGLRQNLSYLDFKRLPIIKIPFSEQASIVQFINYKINQIDQAVELKKAEIVKLKEYKTTLINDAVTGKIKVA